MITEKREVQRFECKGAVEPPPRSAHTTVPYKGELFVFGGWDGGFSNNDFFKYNIGTIFSLIRSSH
jgi:hypothetical protein